jgi:hypothetical protein
MFYTLDIEAEEHLRCQRACGMEERQQTYCGCRRVVELAGSKCLEPWSLFWVLNRGAVYRLLQTAGWSATGAFGGAGKGSMQKANLGLHRRPLVNE